MKSSHYRIYLLRIKLGTLFVNDLLKRKAKTKGICNRFLGTGHELYRELIDGI